MQRTSRATVTTTWREVTLMRVQGAVLRVLQRDVHDGHLTVIVGREPPGWHLSISHRTNEMRPRPKRYPTWDEIADARYRFCPDELTMAMLLLPRDEYVNLHETTFHRHEVEGDRRRTHLEALYRAADCLGVEVVELVPGPPAGVSEALHQARRGRADAEAKLAALSRAADTFGRRHEEILRHA